MPKYEALSPIVADGKTYQAGETVELTQEEAKRLDGLKVIKPSVRQDEPTQNDADTGSDTSTYSEERLQGMTVDELKALAKEKGYDIKGATKKDDIVTEILLEQD